MKKATTAALIGIGLAAVVLWAMRVAGPLPAVGLLFDAVLAVLAPLLFRLSRRLTRARRSQDVPAKR